MSATRQFSQWRLAPAPTVPFVLGDPGTSEVSPFLWTASRVQDLRYLTGGSVAIATAVSANGSVVVGSAYDGAVLRSGLGERLVYFIPVKGAVETHQAREANLFELRSDLQIRFGPIDPMSEVGTTAPAEPQLQPIEHRTGVVPVGALQQKRDLR